MRRGIVVAGGSVVVVALALWLARGHLTMSGGMVAALLVVAALVSAGAGWLLRQTVEGDRTAAIERTWSDRLAATQAELGQVTARANALNGEVRTRDERLAERERQIETLSAQAAKVDALQSILRDKDRLISDLDERVHSLTTALEDRTTAMGQRGAELAAALERQASLEREIAGLTGEMANMVPKSAVDSLAARHSESHSSVNEELTRLKRQLATRDQALKDAAGRIAALETRAAELATLRAQLAEAELRAQHAAERIEDLEREVASRVPEADYQEAKSQIAALRGAANKLADVEIQLLSTGEHATALSRRVHELEERLREMVPRSEYEALRDPPMRDDRPTEAPPGP